MNTLLDIENIVKVYGKHTALNGVSVQIPEGSIFGLLGPNGAGKTSLIRIINQITAPDSGVVKFDGSPLLPQHEKYFGYLPEERGLYRKMKVGEQAMYLAQLKGLTKKDAQQKLQFWFEKFEIGAWWNKKVEELSKGMAQKVQFIVTVLHEPRLLILDEPFSGFDPINTNLIKKEIFELKEKGTTIIFSTHNMSSVEEICDRIALINRANKILEGSVNALKEEFKENVYELVFEGNMVQLTNALWTQFELVKAEQIGPFHKAQIKLLRDATANDLLQVALPYVKIKSLTEIMPSMNDIFIQRVSASSHPIENTAHYE